MSNEQQHQISKKDLLEKLNDARGIWNAAIIERKRDVTNDYRPTSVDHIVLNQFERQEGFLVVGTTLNGNNIHVHTLSGKLAANGMLEYFSPGISRTYTLSKYKGTTIARFAKVIHSVIRNRYEGGCKVLRESMPDLNRTGRTEAKTRKYASM